MKTLGEEIAENLNIFLEASSMSIKNVCDSITDGIEDARLDREEKKCLAKVVDTLEHYWNYAKDMYPNAYRNRVEGLN